MVSKSQLIPIKQAKEICARVGLKYRKLDFKALLTEEEILEALSHLRFSKAQIISHEIMKFYETQIYGINAHVISTRFFYAFFKSVRDAKPEDLIKISNDQYRMLCTYIEKDFHQLQTTKLDRNKVKQIDEPDIIDQLAPKVVETTQIWLRRLEKQDDQGLIPASETKIMLGLKFLNDSDCAHAILTSIGDTVVSCCYKGEVLNWDISKKLKKMLLQPINVFDKISNRSNVTVEQNNQDTKLIELIFFDPLIDTGIYYGGYVDRPTNDIQPIQMNFRLF